MPHAIPRTPIRRKQLVQNMRRHRAERPIHGSLHTDDVLHPNPNRLRIQPDLNSTLNKTNTDE